MKYSTTIYVYDNEETSEGEHEVELELYIEPGVAPWPGGAHTAPSDVDYYGTELDFEVETAKVISGKWRDRRDPTPQERELIDKYLEENREDLKEEIVDYLQGCEEDAAADRYLDD